jgi:hypothetical protein
MSARHEIQHTDTVAAWFDLEFVIGVVLTLLMCVCLAVADSTAAPPKTVREAEMEENARAADEEWGRARERQQREEAIKEAPLRQAQSLKEIHEELRLLRTEIALLTAEIRKLREVGHGR